MNLYVVVSDVSRDMCEVDIRIFGVFDSYGKAVFIKEEVIRERRNCRILKIEKNRKCEVYVGGYIE